MDMDALAALANRLADAAEPVISEHFRTPIDIITKDDASPVTIADRGAERVMRDILEAEVPDHGILGEEYGNVRLDAPTVWVLDPIDGTKAFITGVPQFGTLIAAAQDGVPVLGIINQPVLKERWVGHAGGQSTFNGTPVKTRNCQNLENAILMQTHPDMVAGDGLFQRFQGLTEAVSFTRYGGDCYAYGLLAMGFVDLVVEATLQPYDFAALVPVVEGAGGVMSDWDGKPLTIEHSGAVIASATPALHEAALEKLRG